MYLFLKEKHKESQGKRSPSKNDHNYFEKT